MATRQKRNSVAEPAPCGICGVPGGTPHAAICPFGRPAEPATNGHAAPAVLDGPLFDIHDLSATENERPAPVRINGTPYQWARFGNFGLRRRHELATMYEQTRAIENLEPDQLSDEDEQAYAAAVERIIGIVLPDLAPAHLAALDLQQRQDIATAFLVEFGQTTRERIATATRIAARLPTGASSSPHSNGSTATEAARTG